MEEQVKLGIEQITEMIADQESAVADISRLIALEIAKVVKEMGDKPGHDVLVRGTSQRELSDRIKAYRELQKTLTESEALSKRDVLNLDGPKFQFMFKELLRLFKLALKDAGTEDSLAQNIMLQFADLVKAHDEIFRRDLAKI